MPPKKNYNKMYESKEEVKKEDVVEETPVEEVKTEKATKKKSIKFGRVINGSLNVRKTPNGDIANILKDGENVTIESEKDDWYKISVPYEGYVMKKFIEV